MTTRSVGPVEGAEDPRTFELANGITLELRPASPYLMKSIAEETEAGRPQPPVQHVEAKGRDEPNEDDPEYQQALRQWLSDTGWRTLHVLAATTVKVIEVPDGIWAYDSEDWAEEMASVYGLALEANPKRRLAQWLLLQTTDADLLDLGPMLMQQAGAEEAEVQRALDSFRRNGTRGADTGGPPDGVGDDADTGVSAVPRNRASRRRESRGKV